jgi:hypothetical protein
VGACRVQGAGLRVHAGSRVAGLGLRGQGLGLRGKGCKECLCTCSDLGPARMNAQLLGEKAYLSFSHQPE